MNAPTAPPTPTGDGKPGQDHANRPRFPFSAVVGEDEAKLALVLAAAEPAIGGVLLRGQKGSAKTTLARALAALLGGSAPFVDLPVGATEDRLIGSIDLAAALTGGEVRFSPGLLAAAHGGVLYVDEVNLLPDHLVDVLLDVAVSGVNQVEREGISHSHPSRFVLVGSMNPEEGDLRPQLLDRFGLAADVIASTDPSARAEAVRRRMAFDADPVAFIERWAEDENDVAARLSAPVTAAVSDELVHTISALCVSVGAEGLRADLVICRAAAALAGLDGRPEASSDDVRRVAPLALAHRRRRHPLDDPGSGRDEIDRAFDDVTGETRPRPEEEGERVAEPGAPGPVPSMEAPRTLAEAGGRRSVVQGRRGRLVGDRVPSGPIGSVAVAPTLRAAAARAGGTEAKAQGIVAADVREAVRQERAGNLVILAVDASGSMGAQARMEAAKAAIVGLLLDAYQRRDRVALVTFRGDGAEVALRPTASVEVAKARMTALPTGGRTPLAAGIAAALALACRPEDRPLLVLVSDGRATSGPEGTDPVVAAREGAAEVRRRRVPAVVVDAEDGPTRLGLAAELAEAMGARYLTLGQFSAESVRGLTPRE